MCRGSRVSRRGDWMHSAGGHSAGGVVMSGLKRGRMDGFGTRQRYSLGQGDSPRLRRHRNVNVVPNQCSIVSLRVSSARTGNFIWLMLDV